MNRHEELPYDWEELIKRLRVQGCTVTRATIGIVRRTGGLTETFEVGYGGETHPLQIPPQTGNPTTTVVRSLCNNLNLPYEPFGL